MKLDYSSNNHNNEIIVRVIYSNSNVYKNNSKDCDNGDDDDNE